MLPCIQYHQRSISRHETTRKQQSVPDMVLDPNNSPKRCRILVEINGIVLNVFNSTSRYNKLRDVFKEDMEKDHLIVTDSREIAASMEETRVTDQTDLPYSTEVPKVLLLFPALQLQVKKAQMIVGNHILPISFRGYLRSATFTITYRNSEPGSPDPYIIEVSSRGLKDIKISFDPNSDKDYDANSFGYPKYIPLQTTRVSSKGLDSDVISQDNLCWTMQTKRMQLLYRQAAAGEYIGHDEENPDRNHIPPIWDLSVHFSDPLDIAFEASLNYQRGVLQRFFLPWDYRDMEPVCSLCFFS